MVDKIHGCGGLSQRGPSSGQSFISIFCKSLAIFQVNFRWNLAQKMRGWSQWYGLFNSLIMGFFSHKNCGSWHMCGKLRDIIQYNVKHLMFIVTYELHSNEKLTLGYGKCYEPWLFVWEKSDFILTNLQENVQSCMNFSSRHTWFFMELRRVFFGFHKKRFLNPWINIYFEVEFSHVLTSKIWFWPIQRVFHKKLAQIC